jgi:phage FluMu gp28-like protein
MSILEQFPPAAERVEERAVAEGVFASLPRGSLLLGYQQSALAKMRGGASLLAIEKSRRIGLTWEVAAFAALTAAAQASAGGDNCWYMGYDMEMAREFIETCAMWLRVFGIAAEEVDEEALEDDDKVVMAFRIRCASGFKIVALPSVPRAIRGKQGKVLIDEAAFHKNIGETLKAALALLMWGGQVIVWSTHDGVDNPFNILIDDIKAGRRKGEWMRIDFDAAIADGLYERIAMMARVKGRSILPKDEWIADIFATYGEAADEELRCIPSAGSGSLIKPEDIAAAEHDDAGKPELYTGGLYGIGRDVARRRDGQIILGAEKIGEVAWIRDEYNEVGQTFAHQDAYFDGLMTRRHVLRALIDQTGMGEKVVEDQQLKWGTYRVEGVLLTGPTRLDLALGLATAFQRQLFRIPCNRPDIRADLRAIKRIGSEQSGSIRIVNEGAVHADWFWAAALVWRALQTPEQMIAYRSVPKPDFDGRGSDDFGDSDFDHRPARRQMHRGQPSRRDF